MDLTVGIIENKLRKFSKGTSVSVSCGCCNHGTIGAETILKIKDDTNQTYGYIEFILNASSQSDVKLSKDKEEFYKTKTEKLNKTIEEQELKIKRYEEFINANIKDCERVLKGWY